MERKTNYQYTYFIYPFAIQEENYSKYIKYLLKNKKYQIKYFDSFKDVAMFQYFAPQIRESIFQDFSFHAEKVNQFQKLNFQQRANILLKQQCLTFDYMLEEQIPGKIEEKDGIFFTISQIQLICFQTGICFLLLKTHLVDNHCLSDLLNFNCKFRNIAFENKNIKKMQDIKIQSNQFNTMSDISKMIEDITGKKIDGKKIDIDENLFLVYTYACLEASEWNKTEDFENIENEFVKLAEVKPSDANIVVDYDKLSILADASFMKMRMNNKCAALICSATDAYNYTKLPEVYENQYLYTYIIALHQKYYLKKMTSDFSKKPRKTIKQFIEFTQNTWITEVTEDPFGQKLYKRCREKFNLKELFQEVKNKYDIFYKKLNIEKYKNWNIVLTILAVICLALGYGSLCAWKFFRG